METSHWFVVGIDFSDGAASALEHAVELATEIRASIACVHAYEDAPGTQLLEDGCRKLAELESVVAMSGARSKGIRVETMVRRGPAWEKLVNVACDLGARLIVVGASGQRWVPHHFFLGTVATRVAATSRRMVLIVPVWADGSGEIGERTAAS
jgi:nucleotide-binding universal stress UspA family protein